MGQALDLKEIHTGRDTEGKQKHIQSPPVGKRGQQQRRATCLAATCGLSTRFDFVIIIPYEPNSQMMSALTP